MHERPQAGDVVTPHNLSVNRSDNSRRWIGCIGIVEKYPTPTHGVQVRFQWTDHPDWPDARFVYYPKDLELVRPSVSELERKARENEALSEKYAARAKQLRIKITEAEKAVRVRKIGEVWRLRATGGLFMVRSASWWESVQGIKLPVVRVRSEGVIGHSDTLMSVTDEDFLERFSYVGTMSELLSGVQC